MPIPLIIGGLALASAAVGVKKGFDANDKNNEAKSIVERTKRDFKKTQSKLNDKKTELNRYFKEFARTKIAIFQEEIPKVIKLVEKYGKDASSKLNNENISFTPEEIKQLKLALANSLEISSGLASGAASGALTAMGAYGSVGLLATASTGTAISTLSGAAATNATLAWLGGGSVAAGGGGMALGTAVLGGMVAGPLIAVTGFVIDSKAEENLTKAREYEKDAQIKIDTMLTSIGEADITVMRVNELSGVINKIAKKFDEKYKKFMALGARKKSKKEIEQLLIIGKKLKLALEIPLLDKEGNNNENFTVQIERITA